MSEHTTAMAGLAPVDDPLPTEEKHASGVNTPPSESSDVEKAKETVSEQSPRDVHGFKWALAVFSVLISVFLFSLDNTIVADIQPAIVDDFGQVSKLSWLSVGFLIAAIGTNLFWYVYKSSQPMTNF